MLQIKESFEKYDTMTKIKKFGLAKGIFYALGTSIRFQFKSLFIVTLQINLRHNISNTCKKCTLPRSVAKLSRTKQLKTEKFLCDEPNEFI